MGVTVLDAKLITTLISEQGLETTGRVYFVNNSTTAKLPDASVASNIATDDWGESPEKPFATIDYAIGRCVADRGDVIYVLPGHSETHTAANAGATGAITLDKEGVAIVGLGFGDARPKLLANFSVSTIDLIEVTADSCVIKNLIFLASTTAAPEARIEITDTYTRIEGCTFYCGAFDAISITLPATGDYCEIVGNKFIITADGPDSAIKSEAAVDHIFIKGNYFDGGSTTNQWDDQALDLNAAANTLAVIESNKFLYGAGIANHANGTGLIINNVGGEPYDVGAMSYIPYGGAGGEIKVISPEPTSGGGGGVEVSLGDVFYVDSGKGSASNEGGSPSQALDGLDNAINKTTADNGDMIVLLPGHSEDVTTQIDADVAGIKIIGVGNGELKPKLKNSFTAGTAATLRIDADDIEVAGIWFDAGDTANTVGNIELVAGADDVYIHDCYIYQSTNDVQGITVLGAINRPIIKNNIFRVTGNGPDEAIVCIVGAITGGEITGNLFDGGSSTNAWDDGIISSDQANTSLVIDNNTFLCGTAFVLSGSASTFIGSGNKYGNGCLVSATTPMTFYADNGSTARDGLTPNSPTTLAAAITAVRDGIGDTILLMPGTYTLTTAITLAATEDNVRIGPYIDNGTYNVEITTASDIVLVDIDGKNIEIWGLKFTANAAQVSTIQCIDMDTGDFNRIHDCYFNLASVASIEGINIAATSDDNQVDHCYFTGGVVTVGCITDLGNRSRILSNVFEQNAADSYGIDNNGGGDGQLYMGNIFLGDGGANGAMCRFHTGAVKDFGFIGNYFAGTSSATPFGQNANFATQFINNYAASSAGGVLIDPVA